MRNYYVTCLGLLTALFLGISVGGIDVVEKETPITMTKMIYKFEVEEIVEKGGVLMEIDNNFDVTTPSGYTVEELNEMVDDEYRSGMMEYTEVFVEVEKELGLNSIYLMSTVALESGWGLHKSGDNNLTGMTSVEGGWKDFDSEEESIKYTASVIVDSYIPKIGSGIEEITSRYCPDDEYTETIIWMMNDLQRRL